MSKHVALDRLSVQNDVEYTMFRCTIHIFICEKNKTQTQTKKVQRLVSARINSHLAQNQSLHSSLNTPNKKFKTLKHPKFDVLIPYAAHICLRSNTGSLPELKPFPYV